MEINLNNKPKEIPVNTTVAELLSSLGYNTKGIAVAVNNQITPRTSWDSTSLHPGDNVVIIKAAYGG